MVMFSSFGLTDASKTEAPDELAGFGLDPEKNLKVADDIRDRWCSARTPESRRISKSGPE